MENKNNSTNNIVVKVEDYLNSFELNKIQLVIEAINSNFKVITNKDGEKISKDWEDSLEIYQSITKLIAENLFDYNSGNGFPNAQLFTSIYMDETRNATIEEICVYFLVKKLNSFNDEE